MPDKCLDEVVIETACQADLYPVFLIPVPCGPDFGIAFAEFDRTLGITFYNEIVRARQPDACEYLVADPYDQIVFTEGHVFGRVRQ